MKIFIDTNIFLDLILKRDDFEKALLIFNAIERRVIDGTIADITILNIDYIAKKQVKDIRDFLKHINQRFQIVGADNESISEALNIDNNDLEDNVQYILTKKHKCEIIVSNDKTFYSKNIPVISSAEFVEKYLKTLG